MIKLIFLNLFLLHIKKKYVKIVDIGAFMQKIISLLNYQFVGNLYWLEDVYVTLPPILYALLALVGGAGTVYAIILGINLAKSESDDKRKAASSRLKNTIIGVGVLLLLVLFINIILPEILHATFPNDVV